MRYHPNSQLHKPRRGACGIARLPAGLWDVPIRRLVVPVAQAASGQSYGLLMATRTDVGCEPAATNRERRTGLRKVEPASGENARTAAEAKAHIMATGSALCEFVFLQIPNRYEESGLRWKTEFHVVL